MNRRKLLKQITTGAFALPLLGASDIGKHLPQVSEWKGEFSLDKVKDEAFWKKVKKTHYDVSDEFINLENGMFGVQPNMVVDAYCEFIRKVNRDSSGYVRNHFYKEDYQPIMDILSEFSGTEKEEILITRNATEAMNIIINGLPFKAGDEVIFHMQDYPSMIEAFQMLEKTKGIKIKEIEIPYIPKSDAEIVKLYEEAITEKTKCILVTHMIHLTGQIMPVKAISDMAKKKGVDVIVDAAHSFAHVDFKIPDLGCDFVGVNLHKWFSTPLGMGMLYVKKDRIKDLSPLFGDATKPDDSIYKLGHFGTISSPTYLTIPKAVEFNNLVTLPVKEARLRYLQNYWTSEIKNIPNAEMLTPTEPARSCAIATFKLNNMGVEEAAEKLYKGYGIFTVKRNLPGDKLGIRVTPNLYNGTNDLDRLLEGITALSKV
ncbi:aminotransferase class V-fold PLP-dependent enzyme [Flammeovirgaceae bacterium SG7u.111]|nr:aminotransferase class V-fold PLP-dependent enzyme [Flammeovirgaceae bacterium SG7u.132]WPO37126.1 aminotransferase class V-fold PLP-dependent enzyme [Flammeovirgaceae bacterium SG7u.111]